MCIPSDLFKHRLSDADERGDRLKAFDGLVQIGCDEIRKNII